jgi:hypothetical protein
MKPEYLKTIVESAVNTLMNQDSKLLENDSHEISIAFRLGLYLNEAFKNTSYNIDLEYNRLLDTKNPKKLNGKNVRPDIIIHKRETDKDNLLVIEIKKSSNSQGQENDREKITQYIKELNYQNGLALRIDILTKSPEFAWSHRAVHQ